MNKRIFAVILCVAFSVLFVFSGCSNSGGSQQLSEDEYIEELKYNYHEYVRTISTLFSVLEYGESDFEEIDPDRYEQEYQKAKTALNNSAALTPPEEYSELHSKLKSSVSRELEYIESLNEYYSHSKNYPNLSDDDLSEMERIEEELNDILSDNSLFANVIFEIITYYDSKTE